MVFIYSLQRDHLTPSGKIVHGIRDVFVHLGGIGIDFPDYVYPPLLKWKFDNHWL